MVEIFLSFVVFKEQRKDVSACGWDIRMASGHVDALTAKMMIDGVVSSADN